MKPHRTTPQPVSSVLKSEVSRRRAGALGRAAEGPRPFGLRTADWGLVWLGACLAGALACAPAAFAAATDTNPAPKGSSPTSPGARPETPDAKPQTQAIPRSVFVVPKSRAEGVDPFFPLSKRLDVVEVPNLTDKPAAAGELLVKGFSGTRATPLVIINNRTFGVGDESDVTTPQGRARVRCLEINLRNESVIVLANNERRELRFRTGK